MRLLTKTNRIFLLTISFALVLIGISTYKFMRETIEEENTESLYMNKERVKNLIKKDTIVQMPPIIEVKKLSGKSEKSLSFKDTVLYDPIEKEDEAFTQLTTIEEVNGKFYEITVRQARLETHDYLNNIGLSLGSVFLLILLVFSIINKRIAKKTWQNFYHNLDFLKNFSLETASKTKLHDSTIYEFQQLKEVTEKLTEKVKTDYQNLKDFSENAAHEMQTPLAIIQAKLEQILQSPEINKTQATKINDTILASKRLSKLNKNLLLLTKLENRQFHTTEQIDIELLLHQLMAEAEIFIESKNIELHSESEITLITANAFLTETLLSNLLNNAIKHNKQNGEISIFLKNNTLTIQNASEKLPKNPSEMFQRFTKQSSKSDSLGLGLSIAKKICDINEWAINYRIENNLNILEIQF